MFDPNVGLIYKHGLAINSDINISSKEVSSLVWALILALIPGLDWYESF